MAIKQKLVVDHVHDSLPTDADPVPVPPVAHAALHETAGSDALAHIAAGVIDSGTLDGDRLPAISTTKKGGVPAVTPSDPKEFLRDTGDFEHIVQADCGGLEVAAKPKFSGLGINTPGSDNAINLIEGAQIGVAAGPHQIYRAAAELLEMLGGNVNIGDTPSIPGIGGTWGLSGDLANINIQSIIEHKGFYYASGAGYVYKLIGAVWTAVFTNANIYGWSLCEHNGNLYVGGDAGKVWATADEGASWDLIGTCSDFAGAGIGVWDIVSLNNVLWISSYRGWDAAIAYSSDNGANWILSLDPDPLIGASQTSTRLGVHAGGLYAAIWQSAVPANSIIVKYNGATWDLVHTPVASGPWSNGFSWNGEIWFGSGAGGILCHSPDVVWSESSSIGAFTICGLMEYQGKLTVFGGGSNIMWSADADTWASMPSVPAVTAYYCGCVSGVNLYAGSGTLGKIYIYADTTAVIGKCLKVFGDIKFYGRLMPGLNSGVLGQLFQSGGFGTPIWFPTGEAGTYIGGAADGIPIYKAIPATDLTGLNAAVNEEAISWLSETNVSLAGTGQTTIYTVPTGKNLIIDSIQPVVGSDAGASVITAGQVGALTDFLPAFTLTNLNAQYATACLRPIPNTTPLKQISYAAGTVIQIDVTTAAGGATNAFHLFGFLY